MNSNATRVFALAVTLAAASTQVGNILLNGTFEGSNIGGWTALSLPFANTTGSCAQGFVPRKRPPPAAPQSSTPASTTSP